MMSDGRNVAAKIAEAIFPGKRVYKLVISLEVNALATVEALIYVGDELRAVQGIIGDRPEWRFVSEEGVA